MADSMLESALNYFKSGIEGSAAEALSGVTVLFGPPTGDDFAEKLVVVGYSLDGESGSSRREYRLVQTNPPVDEEFRVGIGCQVVQPYAGVDLKGCYTASTEIAKAVEALLREDIDLGEEINLIEPAIVSEWRGEWVRFDKARGHTVYLTITGKARI